jgi:hypothetical protein
MRGEEVELAVDVRQERDGSQADAWGIEPDLGLLQLAANVQHLVGVTPLIVQHHRDHGLVDAWFLCKETAARLLFLKVQMLTTIIILESRDAN